MRSYSPRTKCQERKITGKTRRPTSKPLAAKPEIMQAAAKPNQALLWLDASVVVNGSLEPVFYHIEQHGYLLLDGGWNNAQWSNDRSLAAFGYDRDEAEKQPQAMAGVFGISTYHPWRRLLLKEWHRQKKLFAGAHANDRQSESRDPRCLGHRHDQTVLSLIAARNGCEIIHPPQEWFCYGINPDCLLNIDGSVNS